MINSVVITPQGLKDQLFIRIYSLVARQPTRSYDFDEGTAIDCNWMNAEWSGPVTIHSIEIDNDRKSKRIIAVCEQYDVNSGETESINLDLSNLSIEDLWQVYLACEPIYQQKMLDYGTIADQPQ